MISFRHTILLIPVLVGCSSHSTAPVDRTSEPTSSREETAPVAGASWGNEIGNGGGVVVCGGKIELIDFAQAQTEGHRFPNTDASRDSSIAQAIERWRNIDEKRAAAYESRAQSFLSRAEFVEKGDSRLQRTVDFGHLMPLPSNCHYEMVAFRRLMVWGSRAKYILRNDLWVAMTGIQQAGLIFHELIGEDSVTAGDEVSESLRQIVAVLFREEPASQEEYEIIRKTVFSESRSSALTKSQILLHLKEGQPFGMDLRNYVVPHYQYGLQWEAIHIPDWVTLNPQTGSLEGRAPEESGRYRLRFALKNNEISEDSLTVEIVVGPPPVL